MAGIRPFDARALLTPPDHAAARAYTERLRGEGRLPAGNTAVIVVAYVFAFAIIGGMGLFLAFLLSIFASVLREGTIVLSIVLAVPVLLGVGALVAAYLIGRRGRREQEERRWRIAGFGRDVGMEYVPAVPEPPLPGVIFSIGGTRTATDVLRGRQPRFVEVGNHSYVISNGKNSTTVRWGYVAIRLGTALPHIVLDATANDGAFGSNLPAAWVRGQRLSLEGDFDRHFRLFCPEGYERDALYLFTPDVMARFIDNAAVLDVEIVDDWLFLYSREELSSTDPGRWAWVFSVISAVLDKLDQWERWRDDRLIAGAAAGSVAPGGPAAPGGPPAPFQTAVPGSPARVGADAAPGGVASGIPAPGIARGDGRGHPSVVPPALLEPGPRGVAAPGRRLRRSSPWVIVLSIVGGAFALGLVLVLVPLVLFLSL